MVSLLEAPVSAESEENAAEFTLLLCRPSTRLDVGEASVKSSRGDQSGEQFVAVSKFASKQRVQNATRRIPSSDRQGRVYL